MGNVGEGCWGVGRRASVEKSGDRWKSEEGGAGQSLVEQEPLGHREKEREGERGRKTERELNCLLGRPASHRHCKVGSVCPCPGMSPSLEYQASVLQCAQALVPSLCNLQDRKIPRDRKVHCG